VKIKQKLNEYTLHSWYMLRITGNTDITFTVRVVDKVRHGML